MSLKERLNKEIKILFGPDKLGPSYPKLPEVDQFGETQVSGLYVRGDAVGKPLLKVGLNEGYEWVEHIKEEFPIQNQNSQTDSIDSVIECTE